MQEFLNEVMGREILITIGKGKGDNFSLSVKGNVTNIIDDKFIIGDNYFSLSLGNMYEITKEDDVWIIKIPKNLVVIISILDKIR